MPHIRGGGLVIIEDTHASYLQRFGNPSRNSPVERSKRLVDLLNSRSNVADLLFGVQSRASETRWLRDLVHSVTFYESMIGFHVNRGLCATSDAVHFGSAATLPGQRVPADLRREGNSPEMDASVLRSWIARVWRTVQRGHK